MFAYCRNNPVSQSDPAGYMTEALPGFSKKSTSQISLQDGCGGGILVPDIFLIDALIDYIPIVEEFVSSVFEYREHTKGARNSTKNKHQKGQTRKNRDNGGEKGDKRRYYKGNKKRQYMLLLISGGMIYEGNDYVVINDVSYSWLSITGGGGSLWGVTASYFTDWEELDGFKAFKY